MSGGGLNRDAALERVRQAGALWDILVIGGGATGVGIAMDAASRGFQTLLVEQSDFGKGTSSRSTKLVHGGVRYLEQGNLTLVRDALRERACLRRNAPHLVKDLPFLIPCKGRWERFYYGLGIKLYDLLAGAQGFGRSHAISLDKAKAMAPALRPEVLSGGVVYHDGQFDDARLLINMVRTAADQGGCLVNYLGVEQLTFDSQQRIDGVIAIDNETGEAIRIKSRCVVNATGPFSDSIRKLENPSCEKMIAASQGVHVVLPKRFYPGGAAMIVPKTADGRVVFMIPWYEHVLIGTTDTAIRDVGLEPEAHPSEIDFLLDTAADYLVEPPKRRDLTAVFTGIRPLVKDSRHSRTASLSRDHLIQVSQQRLVTIAGGKWTTYRKMAEDCVDRVITAFDFKPRPCRTRALMIHGANASRQEANASHEANTPQQATEPRAYYGTDLALVQQLESQSPKLAEALSPDLSIRSSDVIWAVRQEMARTVDDVLARRTRSLFCDARSSLQVMPRVVALMADELGRDLSWCESQQREFRQIASHFLPE
jgi:glycerol-3-phosphate dehydrogenase